MTKHIVNDKLVDMNETEQKAYDERMLDNQNKALPRALEILRGRRNAMLQESDWTDLPNSVLTDEEKSEWQSYRTKLRDLTDGLDTVEKVKIFLKKDFPTKPGE
jgi:1,4-alpha-glucan branching enzyme|tara:strand:+ start:534 stop:845 length:312 start_codon:yes stop_codon:yes gene_type:complete